MFLQLIGEARLLGSWSAADWGDRKKVNFVSVRATPNTNSECQRLARTELGTRTALERERELLIHGCKAPLVVKPYKKKAHLDRPDIPPQLNSTRTAPSLLYSFKKDCQLYHCEFRANW